MKKPIQKIIKNAELTENEKAHLIEKHFCPICGKPSVTYSLTILKNDFIEIDDFTDIKWHWTDDDSVFEIIFIPDCDGLYSDDDEVISFTFEELGIKFNKNNLFKKLHDEYIKNFKCRNRLPYFCSKNCCKKYILNEFNYRKAKR